jgi:Rad3-related DNA helicase
LKISNQAKFKQQAGRAVLIFFDNKDLLSDKFYSLNRQSIPNMRQLHEGIEDKDDIIRKSTASESVTLCTRPFGKGVDYICLDSKTKERKRSRYL